MVPLVLCILSLAAHACALVSLDTLPLGLATELAGDLAQMDFEREAMKDTMLDTLLEFAVLELRGAPAIF